MVTDLYELTMAAAFHAAGLEHEASFELSVRRLPAERRFLVAAGLDAALAGLESFGYGDAELSYLGALGLFPPSFLERLAELRFTGEVWAVPEGEVVFGGEPLVRVTAPLVEGQLVETFLLNQIASHTLVASKAARVALASGDRSFIDFSTRRDHGVAAAMATARSSWIAGAGGTSLVAAGQRWGIPVSGTMAHSFVMAFDDERDAFRTYARAFPKAAILLLDTYDTVRGAHHAVEVADELRDEGIELAGVRLDSGDIAALSIEVRRILDEAGYDGVQIVASGDLDEHRIVSLLEAGAAVDAFGVGTQLGTSADAPSLGAVYKLVEDVHGPKMKLAEGKVTLPGRKQVWRGEGGDVVGLADETCAGRPLLVRVMEGGRRLPAGSEALVDVRARCMAALDALPPALRSLEPVPPDSSDSSGLPVSPDDLISPASGWTVRISDGLRALAAEVRADLADMDDGAAGADEPGSGPGLSRQGEVARAQNGSGVDAR
jgi:nicotinate phosphoribosyltransferase